MQTIKYYFRKLTKHFLITVFKSFIMLLFLNSCLSYNYDYANELCIINGTSDTVFFTEEMRSSNKHYYLLRPYEYYSYGKGEQSVFDLIKEEQRLDVKIEVYKLSNPDSISIEIVDERTIGGDNKKYYHINPIPLVRWEPPLVTEHDSVHSFYNTASWKFTKGGIKCEWDIATFTVTEDDFK